MTAPITVAVIGGGFARGAVAPAYTRHPAFAVASLTSSRDAAAVARECARPDIDLVSVHAAPAQHREIVDLALDVGRHVVCDKPFGADLGDAEHLAARGREHAGVTLTTFQFRHEPWRRAVRDLVATGALGPVESVDWVEHHGAWRERTGGWQLRRSAGGGWLGAMASHTVDTVRWWAGEPRVVAADLPADGDFDAAERSCALILALGAGARASLVARGASSLTSGPRVVVAGAKAAVGHGPDGSLTLHGTDWPEGVRRPAGTRTFPELLDAWLDGVAAAVAAGPGPDVPTFADGLAWARVRAEALAAATKAR